MDFFEILRILAIAGGGLIFGSFVNCVIWRLHSKESFVGGRSYCPRCRHKLAAADLVPLLSFLFLGGKCRYCKENISWQYPLVELATSVLALAAAFIFASGFMKLGIIDPATVLILVYYWAMIGILEIVFVSDLLWYVIPDEAIVFGVGLAALAQIFAAFSPLARDLIAGDQSLGGVFLTAVFSTLVFLGIVVISKGKWMGLGDVKYAFLMGLVLGFPGIVAGLFLAFLSGAVIGLVLIAAGRKKLSSEIPFGPFLAAATLVALFFGQSVINWYLGII